MSSSYAHERKGWQALEQFAAMTIAANAACRSCGRGTTGPLCVTCESHRRDLFRRFGGRPRVRRPGRTFTAARKEWMPFKESEDRQ